MKYAKLPIPAKVLDQHIAVLGKTRAGKSSTMRVIVEALLDDGKPVGIIDPKGDWWGLKLSKSGKSAGYPIVIFGGEHADVPINPKAGAQIAELIATGNRPYLIDFKGWMVGERTRFWIDFASTLFKYTKGKRWLVVDEVHNFAPKGKIMDPDAGKALHWTNRLASEGLGMGLHMVFASQRPQKVHNDTLTSAETLIAKRVIHPRDRDAVAEWIDGCGDPALGKEVLGGLAQLDRSEAWVWSPEIGFGPEKVRFPMFNTFDSFAPQDAKVVAGLKGWADVDLDEVNVKLASLIEEAKASDVPSLRAEIVRLTRELTKKETTNIPQNIPDRETIEKAEERGFERAKRELSAEADKNVRAAQLNLVTVMSERLAPVMTVLQDELKRAKAVKPELKKAVTFTPTPVAAAAVPRAVPTLAPRTPSRANPSTPTGDGSITPVMQRILDAVVEMEALGQCPPPRSLVAVLAGYGNVNSKGFSNALSTLSSMGHVRYPDPGSVAATESGSAIAAPVQQMTADDIQRRAMGIFAPKCGQILGELIKVYPSPIERGELAGLTGYTNVNSKGFSNALSTLSSAGFVKYPSPRQAVAADILFPVGRAA